MKANMLLISLILSSMITSDAQYVGCSSSGGCESTYGPVTGTSQRTYTWRVANAQYTGWRPGVHLTAFKDTACTQQASIVFWRCSGSNAGRSIDTCPTAISHSSGSWRPQDPTPCRVPGECWIEFTTNDVIKCIDGRGLGKGSGGGRSWSGGILVTAPSQFNNQLLDSGGCSGYPCTDNGMIAKLYLPIRLSPEVIFDPLVMEEVVSKTFTVQLLQAPPTGTSITVSISNPKPELVQFSSCDLVYDGSNWNVPQTVYVRSVQTFADTSVLSPFQVDFSSPAFATSSSINFVPPHTSSVPARCKSTGDPHYTTYDGIYYDHYGVGDYVLAQGTGYVVQTRLKNCLPSLGVSCNRGVAVKYGSAVVVMMYNEHTGTHTIDRKGTTDAGIAITYKGSSQYEFALDNGVIVKAGLSFWSRWNVFFQNVYITVPGPLASETGPSMCGIFDGDQSNDYTDAAANPLSHALNAAQSLFTYPNGDYTLLGPPTSTPLPQVDIPSFECAGGEDDPVDPNEEGDVDPEDPEPPTQPPPPVFDCEACEEVCNEIFGVLNFDHCSNPPNLTWYLESCKMEFYLFGAASVQELYESLQEELADCESQHNNDPDPPPTSTDCNGLQGTYTNGVCVCHGGYSGDHCEISPTPSPTQAQNGGGPPTGPTGNDLPDPVPEPPVFDDEGVCNSPPTHEEKMALYTAAKARMVERRSARMMSRLGEILSSDAFAEFQGQWKSQYLLDQLQTPLPHSDTVQVKVCMCLNNPDCRGDPVPESCQQSFVDSYATVGVTVASVLPSPGACFDSVTGRRLLASGNDAFGYALDVTVPAGSTIDGTAQAAAGVDSFTGDLAGSYIQGVDVESSGGECAPLTCGQPHRGSCVEGACVCRRPFGGADCDQVVADCDDE